MVDGKYFVHTTWYEVTTRAAVLCLLLCATFLQPPKKCPILLSSDAPCPGTSDLDFLSAVSKRNLVQSRQAGSIKEDSAAFCLLPGGKACLDVALTALLLLCDSSTSYEVRSIISLLAWHPDATVSLARCCSMPVDCCCTSIY